MNLAYCIYIEKDGKYLTVTRRNSEEFGLPGGKPDPKELPQDTARRELSEETGIWINPFHLIPLYSGVCSAPNEESYWVTTFTIHPETLENENINLDFKVMEEGITPMWRDIGEHELEAYPEYDKNVREAYKKFIGIGNSFTLSEFLKENDAFQSFIKNFKDNTYSYSFGIRSIDRYICWNESEEEFAFWCNIDDKLLIKMSSGQTLIDDMTDELRRLK